MDDTPFADECQQLADAPARAAGPAVHISARVHQRLDGTGDEAIVDEDVLVHVELGIAPIQIAGTIAGHAMPQRQILRARGRADRIRLDETKDLERSRQPRWSEETSRDRVMANAIEAARMLTADTHRGSVSRSVYANTRFT